MISKTSGFRGTLFSDKPKSSYTHAASSRISGGKASKTTASFFCEAGSTVGHFWWDLAMRNEELQGFSHETRDIEWEWVGIQPWKHVPSGYLT